jgi:hypothetical protein
MTHRKRHHHHRTQLKNTDLPMPTEAGDAAFLDAVHKHHRDPNKVEMQQLRAFQQGKTKDGSHFGAHMDVNPVLDKGMDDARPEGGMSYAKLKTLTNKELDDINARKEAAYAAAAASGQSKGVQIDLKTVDLKKKAAPTPTH